MRKNIRHKFITEAAIPSKKQHVSPESGILSTEVVTRTAQAQPARARAPLHLS
jgi:hypothetical protein